MSETERNNIIAEINAAYAYAHTLLTKMEQRLGATSTAATRGTGTTTGTTSPTTFA